MAQESKTGANERGSEEPGEPEQVSARCFYVSKHLSTVRRSAELTAAPRNTL